MRKTAHSTQLVSAFAVSKSKCNSLTTKVVTNLISESKVSVYLKSTQLYVKSHMIYFYFFHHSNENILLYVRQKLNFCKHSKIETLQK